MDNAVGYLLWRGAFQALPGSFDSLDFCFVFRHFDDFLNVLPQASGRFCDHHEVLFSQE